MLHLENSALQEVLEVAIDPPMTLHSPSHEDSLTTNQIFSSASTDIEFNWKKLLDSKLEAIAKKHKEQRFSDNGIEFGKFCPAFNAKTGSKKKMHTVHQQQA